MTQDMDGALTEDWTSSLLTEGLGRCDKELAELVHSEASRQREALSLLAPSMISSHSLRTILGSGFADVDAEGYVRPAAQHSTIRDLVDDYADHGPSKYNPAGPYGEAVERLAMCRVASLAAATSNSLAPSDLYVNVHPLSGAIANVALLRAVLSPGDRILGLDLRSGGHLTHGAEVHLSGMDYKSRGLAISASTDCFPYEGLFKDLHRWRPRAVVIGASSFPRKIDWAEVRMIIDTINPRPWLLADIAHFAGPVFAGLLPSPIDYADATSFVWYKSLGGPRAATLVTSSAEMKERIDRSVFPGLQSAPNLAAIAGIAFAARFAASPAFVNLMSTALRLADSLAEELKRKDLNVAFGGTDSHLLVWRPPVEATPLVALLERGGVLTNANLLPGDSSARRPSGIRMGMVAAAQRGLPIESVSDIVELLLEATDLSGRESASDGALLQARTRRIVESLSPVFPC